MSLNKKGMEMWILVTSILAILALVVFGLFSNAFSKTVWDVQKSETCRVSVLAASRHIELKGSDISGPLGSLNCPTEYVEIDQNNKDAIFNDIANGMYYCWNKMGEGKLDFIGAKDQTVCVVCSKITFSDKLREGNTLIPGFLDYLNENNPPLHNITYLEYFSGYETKEGRLEKLPDMSQQTIDMNNDYYVVYILGKDAHWGKVKSAGLGMGLTGVAAGGLVTFGLVIGAPITLPIAGIFVGASMLAGSNFGFTAGSDASADWGAKVVLVPIQDISKVQCNVLS